jgi:hypothetical protein
MRILYWTDSWLPSIGGIEVLGAQFVRELRGRGFEPLVVTSHCGRELPDHEEWGRGLGPSFPVPGSFPI